jgi:hypothetical protein
VRVPHARPATRVPQPLSRHFDNVLLWTR